MKMLSSLLVFLSFVQHAGATEEADKILHFAIEAREANATNLRSAIASGMYHKTETKAKSGKQLVTKGKVQVFFDGDKYHIRIDHVKHPEQIDRQVIIYDGSALFATYFTERAHPTGAYVEVYESNVRMTGFSFDIMKLRQGLADFELVFTQVPKEDVEVTRVPNGSYQAEYRLRDNTLVTVDILQELGFNVNKVLFFDDPKSEPFVSFLATWKKDKNVWYITEMREQHNFPTGDRLTQSLRYEEFEVNADVPPDLFTLEAAKIPDGSRIHDYRAGVDREDRIHRYVKAENTEQVKLDNLIAQLQYLPTNPEWVESQRAEGAQELAQGTNTGRLWFILINVLALAMIVSGVVFWMRRNRGVF